jgi:hypothetical protein
MTGLKHDVTRRNLAPANVRVVAGGRAGPPRWSRRRTLLFIVLSSAVLWSLIGLGLWSIL